MAVREGLDGQLANTDGSRRRYRVGPGKAANVGGVAIAALEMQQKASRDSWTFEHIAARLAETMAAIHRTCYETAEGYAAPGNYAAGANIADFPRVGPAMLAFGLI